MFTQVSVPDVPVQAAVAAVPAAPERDEETLLAWLSLYLPSWGSSVVLHIAALVLALFMAYQFEQPQKEFGPIVTSILQHPIKAEKRTNHPDNKVKSGPGKFKPNPTSIVRKFTNNPVPGVATNYKAKMEVLGISGGDDREGGFEGADPGRGRFFTLTGGEASNIVYVVDRSGSMTDSLEYVKYELKRSIGELGEECQFHVIFYSSGPPVEMPTRRLVHATDRNKILAFEFIDSVIAVGETDPSKALERAFVCKPDLVYLLTDGEFDRSVVGLVKHLNGGASATVDTIGFLYTRQGTDSENILKTIARENSGQYKFVSEQDLATLVNGR